MKKMQKFLFIFSLIFIAPLAFLFSACDTNKLNADNVQVRVSEDYVQWSYDGANWENIISVNEMKEQLGDTFKGDKVELRKTETHIQWRYENGEWQNLIAIDDISGEDLIATECTITYDFNLNYNANLYASINNDNLFAQEGFTLLNATQDGGVVFTQKATKGNYFDLYDFTNVGLNDYFDGWYVKDIKVNELNIVGGNKTLTAHWKKDFIEELNKKAYYNFQYNESDLTAKFQGFTGETYDQVVNLKELVFRNNAFYTVNGVNRYLNKDVLNGRVDYSKVEIINLPITITDDMDIENLIYNDIYIYGAEKDKDSKNISYCGDYAFVSLSDEYSILEIVYKINYENKTSTIVNVAINKSSNGAINDYLYFSDINVNNDKFNGKIFLNNLYTGILSWKDISEHFSGYRKPVNIVLTKSIDNLNNLDSLISSKGVEESINRSRRITINIFYEGSKDEYNSKIASGRGMIARDNMFYQIDNIEYISYESKIFENVYFYSKNEPISQGAYWKYNEGEISLWYDVSCDAGVDICFDEAIPYNGSVSGCLYLGDNQRYYSFKDETKIYNSDEYIADESVSFSDISNWVGTLGHYIFGYPDGNVTDGLKLNSANSYIVYKFEFTGEESFKATLQYNSNASDENISVSYGTSIDNINSSTPIALNINSGNNYSSTIYIKISINDLNSNAKLKGNFTVNFAND